MTGRGNIRRLPHGQQTKDRRNGRDIIRNVIQWARAAGFHETAADLSDALTLIPEASVIEQLLASQPTDHEEGCRIAWLRAWLMSVT